MLILLLRYQAEVSAVGRNVISRKWCPFRCSAPRWKTPAIRQSTLVCGCIPNNPFKATFRIQAREVILQMGCNFI